MSLTEIAIKRPSLIIVIFSVLILGGLYSYHQLGYQLMPNFSQPIINVVTVYPGATPSEVESKVTRPIEDAISALDRIDDINSKSYENISVVTIGFESGTNLDKMMQEAQRKIDNIKSELPDDVKSPSLSKVSQDDLPIMHLIATSDLSSGAFYTLIEDQIKPQIQQISGVGEIIMLGGEEREIRINADLDKLNYYGISLLQLNSAIQAANIEIPTGKVETSQSQATLRLSGKFQSMDEIREQVILSMGRHNSPVRIGDVADITDATKDVSTIARLNGKTGVAFLIKKQPDANAVAISHQVKQQIETIERLYASQNVKVLISEDSADFTMESVEAVQHDLVIAIILVASVMLLFLHSLRNALIVMLSIPTSLISTLIAMNLLDYSFNLMTLLAMSLVIGILVDDSIVVLENIQRHLEMGKDKRKAALDGRNEIGFSALAITFVDVVVFLPIIVFVNTTVGEVLRQFSVVVVVSTLMSLFVCFTLTPWLASRFGKVPHLNPQNPFGWFLIQFEHGLDQFTNWYKTQLIWALNNRIISFCIILSCFGGLGWMMSLGIMGEELVAAGDQGKLTLGLEFDKRSSIENTNLQTRQVEDMLLARPEVKTVFANIGGPSTVGGSLGAANKSELSVKLVDKNQRRQSTEELMLAMREEIISRIPGVNVEVSKVSIKGGAAPLQIVLTAADYDKLFAVAQRLKEKMQQLPGVDNVKISVEDGAPELNISIDREQLATLALDMRMVAGTLRTAFNGNDDAEFKDGSNNYDIRLMADRFDRENPDDLRNIEIINQRGEPVKFSQFATISLGTAPSQLERYNRQPSLTITGHNQGTTPGVVGLSINALLEDQSLIPSDVNYVWSGDIKLQEESLGALLSALGIGLLCIYLLMVALYNNFLYPFVVLFSIPVALLGAFAALNLSMTPMSVYTQMGIIMLLGLVAKNGILIVDFANQLKSEGKPTYSALIEAATLRLRPILMTTIAMVLGMLPIALSTSAGSEFKSGLGLVLVGGLTSSMMLTVFIVPMVYLTVDQVIERLEKHRTFIKKPQGSTMVS